jgi:hypothetical protein
LPAERKDITETFYLEVPTLECSSEAEIYLVNDLLSDTYFFEFKKKMAVNSRYESIRKIFSF